MQKAKLIVIGFIILIVLVSAGGFAYYQKKYRAERTERERIERNQEQLLSDARQQTELFLREKEVTGRLKRERDSLAAALKIKPKQVQKIIYIDNSTHDTIPVPVPVYITGPDKWKITDGNECFKWAANAFREGDSLKIQRTLFEYDSRTTQTFYKKAPHIWFIRTGKWKYYQQISSTCGSTTIQTFNFTK